MERGGPFIVRREWWGLQLGWRGLADEGTGRSSDGRTGLARVSRGVLEGTCRPDIAVLLNIGAGIGRLKRLDSILADARRRMEK